LEGAVEWTDTRTVDLSKVKSNEQQRKEDTATLTTFAQSLVAMVPKWITMAKVQKGELIVHTPVEYVHHLLQFLRDHSNALFTQVVDVTGVDYPDREKRFEVVYSMVSYQWAARIRVKTFVDEMTPVPTAVDLFDGADWFEREVWDMFGVFFSDHPDLRRILTDYGFEGYPMRKDFPLTGYVEVRYDDEEKRVVQEDLELAQEFRKFDFKSPWEQFHPPPEQITARLAQTQGERTGKIAAK
jgi:NADH dehydrogenase (ubiquinone) Fe-S protein 3